MGEGTPPPTYLLPAMKIVHTMQALEIVEFPYDRKVWRFGKTYSIRENGEFWLTSNGSRRSWSYLETAMIAANNATRGG